MGTSSGFKNTGFYEAERTNIQLSHNDLSIDDNFDERNNSEKLIEHLLAKDYDKYFKVQRQNQVTVDTKIANAIFIDCYEFAKYEMDTVQIFDTITDFFKIDSKHYFDKLVQKFRLQLHKDLRNRIELPKHRIVKTRTNTGTVIQRSFQSLED